MKTWFEITNAADGEAEILIYDYIGGWDIDAKTFIDKLNTITAPVINVRINSNGGETFQAFAIANAMMRHPAKIITHIDALAASAATYPALAGNEIRMANNAMLMIHNPMTPVFGDADELRYAADMLEKTKALIANFYVEKTGQDLKTVSKWMDSTTWFNAAEAKENGFVHTIVSDMKRAESEVPQNRVGRVWNFSAQAKGINESRIAELGLAEMFQPTNSDNPDHSKEIVMVTLKDVLEFIEKNPSEFRKAEPVNKIAADEYARGKTEAEAALKPKNATASELKAAFPNDREFVMDRLDTDAPINEHKVAFAAHLQNKLTAAQQQNDELKKKLAEIDPSLAGTSPVNTSVNTTSAGDVGDKPMTKEREQQLLSASALGISVLNSRSR